MSAEIVIDGVSIASSGSETSNTVDVRNETKATLYVEGDSNSTDIDVTAEAKVRSVDSDSWAEHDATVTNDDVTSANNNAKTYTYDVKNLTDLRFVVDNNAASSTTVTAISSVEQ